jgi:RNA polymerase sigma factor (sigma-70 family)
VNLERDLKKALEKGDPEQIKMVCSVIYQEYYRLLFYVSLGILSSREEAEDAAGEAFLSFFSRLEETRKARSIKYYLVSSVRFISYKRKKKDDAQDEFSEETESPSEDLLAKCDASSSLQKLKGALSAEEMSIVVQHLEYDLTFKEIARAKNVSEDSISSKYRRAIEKLRGRLRGERK